jgi:hypothetical protein
MRVLILTDDSFAARERAMLSRLEVGLADDGVRVVHAIPRKAAAWHQPEVFSQAMTYEAKGLALSRPWRARQTLRTLEDMAGAEGRPADVIHCFGQRCWPFAAELARMTGAALAVEIWCAELIGQGIRVRSDGGAPAPVYFVPDSALERAARSQDPNLPIRLTPWGVHTPGQPLEILRPDKAVSIILGGNGRDATAIASFLEGFAAFAKQHPDVMVLADSTVIQRAQAWPVVRRLGLLDKFTLIPDLEARRELALRADLLALPEALGEHRTLTLDAMAHGMLVVAAADPLNGVLVDSRTAKLLDKPVPDSWALSLTWALESRDQARSLAWSGREYVRLNRRASAHVASVVDAYEWMTSGESIPFGAA